MNPLRQAIFDALAGDATLTALLSAPTAIHHRKAPREAMPPFVVFQKLAGTNAPLFQGARITREMWLAKALDLSSSASTAEDIAKAIDNVLHSTTLTLSTGAIAVLMNDSDVDYDEMDGADQWQHVGAIYRVIDP